MAGFTVDYTPGKLVFPSGYVLPNPAVRFDERSTLGMWFPTWIGEDVETTQGWVRYPRVPKGAEADLDLEVSQNADSAGGAAVGHAARVLQLKANIAELAAEVSSPDGLQTVEYTPSIGETPIEVAMVVEAPMEGAIIRGVGLKVILPVKLDEAVS